MTPPVEQGETVRRIPNETEVQWYGMRVRVTSHVPECHRYHRHYRATVVEPGPFKGQRKALVASTLERQNPDAVQEVPRGD